MSLGSPRNVFIYWSGFEYKLIKILRKIMYLHQNNGKGYKLFLITNENVTQYLGDLPSCFYNLKLAHQADFVRVNVICNYGGIWLDSDTIVMDTLDSLFNIIENKNGFFVSRKDDNVTYDSILSNGIFGSKPSTPIMIEWKNRINAVLEEKNENIGWTEIGSLILDDMYTNNSSLYDNYDIIYGKNNIYPINWQNILEEFTEKPYENYVNIKRDWQPLIVLIGSVYRRLESKTEKEILREKTMPLNYFLLKSFDLLHSLNLD